MAETTAIKTEPFQMQADGGGIKPTHRTPIVDKCEGCARVAAKPSGKYCAVFAFPDTKWQFGWNCNMATHVKREEAKEDKKMLNPLKASKRAAAGGGAPAGGKKR
jgi:hypothetical protein